MANIAVVNSKITSLNVDQLLTMTAADETADATAQKFVYTPTGRDNKIVWVIYNAAAEALTATFTAGVNVFGAAEAANTLPATIGNNIIQCETGKFMLANGTIELSVLPGGGKDLTNDNALTVGVIELQ